MSNLNLYKINSIWTNLENSYQLMKSSLGVNTRIEFFNKVIGKDENHSNRLIDLKLLLSEESSKYNEAEMESYNNLCRLFTAIENGADKIKVITDFNKTLDNLLNDRKLDLTIQQVLEIANYRVENSKTLTIEDMLRDYKDLHATTTIDGSVKEIKMQNTLSEMMVYNKEELRKIYSRRTTCTDIERKILYFCTKTKVVDFDILFMNNPEIVNDNLVFGRKKIQLSEEKVIGEEDGTSLSYREGKLTTTISEMKVIVFI